MSEKNPKLSIFKTEDQIKARVKELGADLTRRLKGAEPVCICVLNGSFIFYSDLIRNIELDVTCEFLGVSLYKNQNAPSGEVAVNLDLGIPLAGKDVVLVEDLVDSGMTMNYLTATLNARKPRSLTTVSLLLKAGSLREKCKVDFVGFELPDKFVVGYGIDHEGKHRSLPYLAVLD